MAGLFYAILQMSVSASIIALIVMIARYFLRNSPKIYSYILWAAVLLRMICPFSLTLEIPVAAPQSEQIIVSTQPENTSTPDTFATETLISDPASANPSDEIKESQHTDTPETVFQTPVRPVASNIKVIDVMTATWLIGTACMLGYMAWSYISLYSHVKSSTRVRGTVFKSDRINTAFVLGLFSPKVYIPSRLSFDDSKSVILHEQTHISRGDHIVKIIAFISLAVHWFNPFIWLSYRLMNLDMEQSCDESVIRGMNSRGYDIGSVKKKYGQMLIALADNELASLRVAFAKSDIEKRMKNLLSYRRSSRRSVIILSCVSLLITVSCMLVPMIAIAESPGLSSDFGNTSGNCVNRGLAVSDGEWLYSVQMDVVDHGYIYDAVTGEYIMTRWDRNATTISRRNLVTGEETRFESGGEGLNLYNGKLYYYTNELIDPTDDVGGSVYAVNTDGTNPEKLYESARGEISNLCVAYDKVYFIDNNEAIVCVDLNSGVPEEICKGYTHYSCFCVTESAVIFCAAESDLSNEKTYAGRTTSAGLYSCSLSTGEVRCLVPENAVFCVTYENSIFYLDLGENNEWGSWGNIVRTDINGSSRSVVAEYAGAGFNLHNGRVYYTTWHNDSIYICSKPLLGGEIEYIRDMHFSPIEFCIVDELLLYVDSTAYSTIESEQIRNVESIEVINLENDIDYSFLEDFQYSIEDGYAVLTGYTGKDPDIKIPKEYDGIPVQIIGESAFAQKNIKSVRIPDTVKIIRDHAFESCGQLETVELPYGLVSIGDYAFRGCGVKHLNIPDSVLQMGEYCFSGCSHLSQIILSKKLSTIRTGCFEFCSSLEDIYFPASVTAIETGAFTGSGVKHGLAYTNSLYPPNYEGWEAWPLDVYYLNGSDGLKYEIYNGTATVTGYSGSDERIIVPCRTPDGTSVRAVGNGAFADCNARYIELSCGVTYIGNHAFSECSNLEMVYLPAGSFIQIEDDAFSGYTGGVISMKSEILTEYFNRPENNAIEYYCSDTYSLW